jgi:ATP-dependent Clp protease adaptor protein ClpS
MGEFSPPFINLYRKKYMTTDTVIEKNKTVDKKKKLQPPPKYNVVIMNDDYTPMDLVIAILMTVFKHSFESATDLTIRVHEQGKAVAGTYSYEIAEQKVIDATDIARRHSSPLVIKAVVE